MYVPVSLWPLGPLCVLSCESAADSKKILVSLFRLFRQSFLRLPCVFGKAVERRHVVMVSILSVDGYVMGASPHAQVMHEFGGDGGARDPLG